MGSLDYSMEWIGASGEIFPFDGSQGVELRRGLVGFEAPPLELGFESRLSGDGSILTNRRRAARRGVLDLVVQSDDTRETIRNLVSALNDRPGVLRRIDQEVGTRELHDVEYESGLEGDEGTDRSWTTGRWFTASLIALDPYWYGDQIVEPIALSVPTTTYTENLSYSVGLPYIGGVVYDIGSEGDEPAYPVVTLTGPASKAIVLVGSTNDRDGWGIAAPLAAGDVLTVDHRPSSRGPRLNGGPVYWPLLRPHAHLFTMSNRWTSMAVGVKGIVDGVSALTVGWQPRLLVP